VLPDEGLRGEGEKGKEEQTENKRKKEEKMLESFMRGDRPVT
jgi:hypothetical protein